MAKFVSDVSMDAMLTALKNEIVNGDVGGKMTLTIGQPATAAASSLSTSGTFTAGDEAAEINLIGTDFDSIVTDGSTGRRLAINPASPTVNALATKAATDHVVLWNSTTNKVVAVTTIASGTKNVDAADQVTFNAWNIDSTYA